MVSRDLLYQIHTRLVEIFDCGPDQPFVRTSVSICWDFYQLPPEKVTMI